MAIPVKGLGAEKQLEIAGEMRDHKQEQEKSRNGHDVFPAQRRFENVRKDIHGSGEPAQPGAAPEGDPTSQKLMATPYQSNKLN